MRLLAGRPIVWRLVAAVAAAMAVVLVLAGAFVYWRVAFALDRQVDQDLAAYRELVEASVHEGRAPVRDTPGEAYQTYAADGSVTGGSAHHRLASAATVRAAYAGDVQHHDHGRLLPATEPAERVVTARMSTPDGPVVVAYAISRAHHDEALRELLAQLAIAGAATLAAASAVGWWTARAALGPVERYRAAAASAAPEDRLPVPEDRDDELTRLGHTLNDLLDRLAASAERERQFLADASHELRSPLTVMQAELDWARLRPRDAAESEATMGSLQKQVRRMIALCEALLDLEEVRAQEPPTGDVDTAGLVTGVAARHRPEAEAAGRSIATDTAGVPDLCGNPDWLDLALDNLVGNALRHGAGTVTVAARAYDGRVRLTVSDEGPGFPPEFVATAFDRFSRAEGSRTTPGTGLGLALVKAVAEAHRGTVAIDGSAVTLDVPAARG
ncbi:HAMP domain-containing sensor histidine kinase [Nocardioides sp. KR10-350]|uniref:sensor histidine kinase n=1 Tax=Nocardioides cheoyonin TaxID=3156615 RepID=UPI0032B4AE6C